MIEFFGELSEKCKIETAKKRNKSAIFWFWIVAVLLGIVPTIVLGTLKQKEFYGFLVWTIALIIITTLNMLPSPKSRVFKFSILQKITIEKDSVALIAYQGQKIKKIKQLSKVKKIIDAGEWYYIIFKFGDISNSWVCQKDLITKGTIEEFEKIFEGKIVRGKKS